MIYPHLNYGLLVLGVQCSRIVKLQKWAIRTITRSKYNAYTVYPKKYAHGFCFAVLCCGYTLTDFPISIRLTSLALWQSNDCPSASKATLMNMDKYFMWIHYERLHNHNKAKHNKIVCIFLGIYCTSPLLKHIEILSVNDMLHQKALIFHYKYVNKNLPHYFDSFDITNARIVPQLQYYTMQ